jgi:RNA ligase
VPRLHDLFDILDFHAALEAGYIDVKKHPTEMLWIANYTAKAQYERVWTPVTKQCRGLIFDFYNEIVARPFPKFFNLGEVERDMLPGGQIRVMEKMDGSLGILYQERTTRHQPKYAIATRGSFESDQARHATALLRQKYPWFEPTPGFTYLFEIIYPENRIVVDYEGKDNLYLLDIIDNETGRSALHYGPVQAAWTGPRAWTYDYKSITDVLAAESKNNAEGFVVHFAKDETRVKVKFEEYVRLHRLITGVSTKTIWELLSTNSSAWDEMLDRVPDEFYEWVKKTAEDLQGQFQRVKDAAWDLFKFQYAEVQSEPGTREHRKEFAGLTKDFEHKALLWLFYDDKDVSEAVWKLVKPAYSKPFWNVDEATA